MLPHLTLQQVRFSAPVLEDREFGACWRRVCVCALLYRHHEACPDRCFVHSCGVHNADDTLNGDMIWTLLSIVFVFG